MQPVQFLCTRAGQSIAQHIHRVHEVRGVRVALGHSARLPPTEPLDCSRIEPGVGSVRRSRVAQRVRRDVAAEPRTLDAPREDRSGLVHTARLRTRRSEQERLSGLPGDELARVRRECAGHRLLACAGLVVGDPDHALVAVDIAHA